MEYARNQSTATRDIEQFAKLIAAMILHRDELDKRGNNQYDAAGQIEYNCL